MECLYLCQYLKTIVDFGYRHDNDDDGYDNFTALKYRMFIASYCAEHSGNRSGFFFASAAGGLNGAAGCRCCCCCRSVLFSHFHEFRFWF